jgi:hypothetical protein
MLPTFPQFKSLEQGDKILIEAFTHGYPPFSDFNFTSLWTWNIKEDGQISQLNNHLILRYSDYVTGQPFYSVCGHPPYDCTVSRLLSYCNEYRFDPCLRLIPEHVALSVAPATFHSKEDPDNHDYVYCTAELSLFSGSKFATKRYMINSLLAKFDLSVCDIDLMSEEVQNKIHQLFDTWTVSKINQGKQGSENEHAAFDRLITLLPSSDIHSIGIFINHELVGLGVFEIVSQDYGIIHFSKTTFIHSGLPSFLMKMIASKLKTLGIRYMNHEQDLGLPNLRESKRRFRPAFFLKKYTIGPKCFTNRF